MGNRSWHSAARFARLTGMSFTDIARRFGVSRTRVAQVCKGIVLGNEASRPLHDRFLASVDFRHHSECWPWRGYVGKVGYGLLSNRTRPELAHRVAYRRWVGPIPRGLYVCHACDNPVCCNPSHLWIGTAADNNRDRDEKGRSRHDIKVRGEEHHQAKLTAEQALEIWNTPGGHIPIAERFNITPATVSLIKRGKIWKHITPGRAPDARSYRTRKSKADAEAA